MKGANTGDQPANKENKNRADENGNGATFVMTEVPNPDG